MKAGVTGHRELDGQDTVAWVRARLEEAVDDLRITAGLTSLAVGADQMFADLMLDRHLLFTAVIPSDHYETTFASTERPHFDALRNAAAHVICLPFSKPSEDAYMSAGKAIVDGADLLIAIWNGKPARGYGGTADVVDYALASKKKVRHINPASRTVNDLP